MNNYFTDDALGQDETEDYIFYDMALLDKILEGMAALAAISATHNISGKLTGILTSKYLMWVISEIKKLEVHGHPDWHSKDEILERLTIINDFYNFLEDNIHKYNKKTYDYIKEVYKNFKETYIDGNIS